MGRFSAFVIPYACGQGGPPNRECYATEKRATSDPTGLPDAANTAIESAEVSQMGQTANCLTIEPLSAVGRIADPQPSRALFPSELCLLVRLIAAAVPS